MEKIEMTIYVKEGRKNVAKRVIGRLIRFPKKSLTVGIKRYEEFRKKKDVGDYTQLRLLNYKNMWWLHYGINQATGHFESKQKAIDWFEKAGR